MRLHWHLLVATALAWGWSPGRTLRASGAPAPPAAEATPAAEQERKITVPTGFRAARTADVLAVCEHSGPMKPITVKLRPQAVLATTTKLFIYPEGTVRPGEPRAQGGSVGSGAPFKVSNLPGFYASEPFGFVERGKPYVIEIELALYDTILSPVHRTGPGFGGLHWMSPGKNDQLLWQTTLRQVVKEEPELPSDIRAAKAQMERIKPQPAPLPEIPADFLRTDSDMWQRVLATPITASFGWAVVSKVIPYLGLQAHADIRLKLTHTTPERLRPFIRGYEGTPLRGVLYEIAEDNQLTVKWELKAGSPVGIVVTDER